MNLSAPFFKRIAFGYIAIVLVQLFPLFNVRAFSQQKALENSLSSSPQTALDSLNIPARAATPVSITPILKFQAGDAVKLTVYPDTTRFPSGIYFIDSYGFIDLPLIGFIKVTGITPDDLEKLLNEKYVSFLPRPTLVVRPLIRISLLGGFLKPGLYLIDPRESIWKVIECAGGTQREDGIRKIRWERGNAIIARNIVPSFEAGQSLYAIGFKSGDQLVVTPKPRQSTWESFKVDVLPIASILLSTAISAASVYLMYDFYQQRR